MKRIVTNKQYREKTPMVNGAASFTTLWRDRGSTLAKWKVLQDAADDSRDEERDSCARFPAPSRFRLSRETTLSFREEEEEEEEEERANV